MPCLPFRQEVAQAPRLIKTADGTEKTFEYTDDAAKDVGKAVGKGAEKGAKVTVYYTEDTAKQIAHFFEYLNLFDFTRLDSCSCSGDE